MGLLPSIGYSQPKLLPALFPLVLYDKQKQISQEKEAAEIEELLNKKTTKTKKVLLQGSVGV